MGFLVDLALAARKVAANMHPSASTDDGLSDPAAQARHQRVLDLLGRNPKARYAVITDDTADPENVIVVLAIRGKATCELHVPRGRYDGVLLLGLIERHGTTVH